MRPVEDQQSAQKSPRFTPDIIDDARAGVHSLADNFERRKEDKTKAAILQTISGFKDVVGKIPDLFTKEKEFLLLGIGDFATMVEEELTPFEKAVDAKSAEVEAATKALAERSAVVLQQLAALQQEIDNLKETTEQLRQSEEKLKGEYEQVTHGNNGLWEWTKNLKPGRKKALSEAARLAASQAFKDHSTSRERLRAKQSEHYNLKTSWDSEKFHKARDVKDLNQKLKKAQEELVQKFERLNVRLIDWIRRLHSDIEACANGGSLNMVDIRVIDTRSRANGIAAMASKDLDQFSDKLDDLSAYRTSGQGVHPISADPGDNNQTSFEYFVDDSTGPEPTLFYTGQILETSNDSVSRRFVACTLVEVFSPKSKKHVAFHLPPRWMKQFGMTQGANFSEYNPLFFYEKLKDFVQKEGCDFEDLDIKIVSGVNVPPDQIAASLKAIGCDEKKIGVFQLPVSDFSTLTLAEHRKVLILGEKIKFLEPGERRDGDIFIALGGDNGRGQAFYDAPGISRFAL